MFPNSLDFTRSLEVDNASCTRVPLKLLENHSFSICSFFLEGKNECLSVHFFFFPELKMCETFQSKVFPLKDIHFAGLFWLLIFYLINEMLQYVVSNGHFILTFSLHSGAFKFFFVTD